MKIVYTFSSTKHYVFRDHRQDADQVLPHEYRVGVQSLRRMLLAQATDSVFLGLVRGHTVVEGGKQRARGEPKAMVQQRQNGKQAHNL